MKAGPGGLFGSRSHRRMLNLFEVSDTRAAARGSNESAMVRTNASDVRFEGGSVVMDARTTADEADDVRVLDGILLSPALEATHPARLDSAKKIFEALEHRTRFIDLAATDGQSL